MRSTVLYERHSEGREYVEVSGSFAPASTGTPTALKGKGFTVVCNSAGVFTLTFQNDYADLVDVTGSIQLATPADLKFQPGTYTAPTSSAKATLVVNALAVATPTDIAANANNRVNFRCTFRKGAVTP